MSTIIETGRRYLRQFGAKATCAAVLLYASRKLDATANSKLAESRLPAYDFDQSDLKSSHKIVETWQLTRDRSVSSVNWFIPSFSNVYGGGYHTIFRFADYLSRRSLENRFIVQEAARQVKADDLQVAINDAFPDMTRFSVIVRPRIQDIPPSDVAIATTWQSAYDVLHFNSTLAKYYFIQDFEPLFCPAGSEYALAEATYRFGFPAITFGRWLREMYVNTYHQEAIDFVPCAETEVFGPASDAPRKEPRRVFFYARPISERRAFELGIMALTKLAKKHPHLEIILAGSDIRGYRIPFCANQLGNITLSRSAAVYRDCDMGLSFSMTNLSLLPLQLMASGCTAITNQGPNVEWLLKHRYNCLLTDPTPSSIVETFEEAMSNYELRKDIFKGGLETTRATSWDREFDKVYHFMLEGDVQPERSHFFESE